MKGSCSASRAQSREAKRECYPFPEGPPEASRAPPIRWGGRGDAPPPNTPKFRSVVPKGAPRVPLTGSTISRMTDCGVFTRCGYEIGVASTKAFTAQISVLYMFALKLADRIKNNNINHDILQTLNRLFTGNLLIKAKLNKNSVICQSK